MRPLVLCSTIAARPCSRTLLCVQSTTAKMSHGCSATDLLQITSPRRFTYLAPLRKPRISVTFLWNSSFLAFGWVVNSSAQICNSHLMLFKKASRLYSLFGTVRFLEYHLVSIILAGVFHSLAFNFQIITLMGRYTLLTTQCSVICAFFCSDSQICLNPSSFLDWFSIVDTKEKTATWPNKRPEFFWWYTQKPAPTSVTFSILKIRGGSARFNTTNANPSWSESKRGLRFCWIRFPSYNQFTYLSFGRKLFLHIACAPHLGIVRFSHSNQLSAPCRQQTV